MNRTNGNHITFRQSLLKGIHGVASSYVKNEKKELERKVQTEMCDQKLVSESHTGMTVMVQGKAALDPSADEKRQS